MMFLLILLFSNLAFCSSLECYACLPSSGNLTPQCNSTVVQECGAGIKYCVYLFTNNTVLAQSCVPEEDSSGCESNSTGVITENGIKKNYVCCETDLCNAPTKISSTVEATTESREGTTAKARSSAMKKNMSLCLNVAKGFFAFFMCFIWFK